jgi:phosphinothricin acetyltransferase
VVIEEMCPADWDAVARIYAEGMATGNATFETDLPSWESWDAGHLGAPRLVARIDGEVAGWAVLAPVSDRCAYAGVAENSVYVSEQRRGLGVGRQLLERLLTLAEEAGIWTVQTGIFPENQVSIRLHEACGFRTVGVRERVGKLDGRWRDVVFLERRSERVGID